MLEEVTLEEVKRLLNYDPLTGIFTWRVDRRIGNQGHIVAHAGDVAGAVIKDGYVRIVLRRKGYRAHRLAWLYMTGEWPTYEVDHENCQRADNRWDNLRDLPTAINAQNKRKAQSNSKTGLLGASWSSKDKRFTARIKVNGRYLSLGYHDTAEAAHAAYVTAKRQHHAGCTI